MHNRCGAITRRSVQSADDCPKRRARKEASPVPDAAVDATRINCTRLYSMRLKVAVQLAAEKGVGKLGVLVLPLPPVVQELLGIIEAGNSMGYADQSMHQCLACCIIYASNSACAAYCRG